MTVSNPRFSKPRKFVHRYNRLGIGNAHSSLTQALCFQKVVARHLYPCRNVVERIDEGQCSDALTFIFTVTISGAFELESGLTLDTQQVAFN